MSASDSLDPNTAKRVIRDWITRGSLRWSNHALERIPERGLTTVDCVNALKSGVVDPPEWENGSWRYRVRSGEITVVVAFRGEREVTVTTAWR